MGDIAMAIAVAAAFAALAVWMVTPAPPPGFYWDDTWYLLMAEWLQVRGETLDLTWSMLQQRQYPPLFPYALSLAGAGLDGNGAAYVMNAVFVALAGGVAVLWMRLERMTISVALIGAALVVFNPVALYWLPTLFSEHLYLLLSTLALLLARLRPVLAPIWLVIGIVSGLAVATRSTGMTLVAALLVHLVLQRRWVMLGFFAGGCGIALLTIPYLTVGLPDAPSYLFRFTELPYDPGLAFLLGQATAITRGWVQLWGSVPGAVILFLAAVPGCWLRLRQNRPDAWYVLAYFAMLLIWPYPDHMDRFLWPLAPALVISALSLLQRFGAMVGRVDWTVAVLSVVLLASLPAGLARSLNRLLDPPPGDLAALSRMPEWTRSSERERGLEFLEIRLQMLRDMQRIGDLTDPGDCIYSELPALVVVQAKRVSLASPWENLGELSDNELNCAYYYLVPGGLPGTTPARLSDFRARHAALFRSQSPYVPGEVLGIFFRLTPESCGER